MANGAEQRKYRRFDMSIPVKVKVKTQAAPPVQTVTRDISGGGLYFSMSEEIEPGSDLECEVTLPPDLCQGNTVRVRCRGKIVRVERREGENKIGVAATIEHFEFMKTN